MSIRDSWDRLAKAPGRAREHVPGRTLADVGVQQTTCVGVYPSLDAAKSIANLHGYPPPTRAGQDVTNPSARNAHPIEIGDHQ